jgi:hypothetical protein
MLSFWTRIELDDYDYDEPVDDFDLSLEEGIVWTDGAAIAGDEIESDAADETARGAR